MSSKEFNDIFSKRLKQYLEAYEMSQAELAKRLSVSPTAVNNWCLGIKSPRMDKVDAMCQIFHCNRSDLIMDKDEPIIKNTPAVSARVNDFIKVFDSLTEEQQAQVFDYVEFLSSKTPPSP